MTETETRIAESYVTDAVVNGWDAIVRVTSEWAFTLPANDVVVTIASWF